MPDQTGYQVGWFTLALINAALAQGKGRPGSLWFLISVLLGPLGTLAIVLLPAYAIDPESTGGGRRPYRFTRSDWVVAGVVLAIISLVLVVFAAPIFMVARP